MESNPAYNEQAEVQRYTKRHEIDDSITRYTTDLFNEPQVTVGSVVSTTSSQYYSKPTFDAAGTEDLQDSCNVYYSQPFSSHHSLAAHANTGVPHNAPPLPKSGDGDGIATLPNISYRKISSEAGPKIP